MKRLRSNSTDSEGITSGLTSFNSDGFSLGTDSSGNSSGGTYVAWCWKAGGGSNTFNVDGTGYATASAAGITDGSIALTGASVNTTAGFSIVSYTGNGSAGATIGHGLGNIPSFIIIKDRVNGSNGWPVFHKSTGNTDFLYLNDTSASIDNNTAWNDTSPTSDVFTVGAGTLMNTNGNTYIAYCWAEIEGFSKFGSYTGNGSTNGPFVNCGFKPAWVMIKAADDLSPSQAYASWAIKDSSRNPYNKPDSLTLWANEPYTEDKRGNGDADTFNENFDFLSNGFKMSSSSSYEVETNKSGVKYIFAAFAESPFKTANAK